MNERLSRRGEAHGRHRLTEGQVRDIRHRWATWSPRPTQMDLALDFDVCQATIWLIVTGQTWRHVRDRD